MADRIKGIVVEIGGDTTKLSDALKSVNKSIKETESQLKDVNKLLKLDPGNTDLLTQKQKYLTEGIDDTKKKLAQEKDALSQLKAGPQTEETIKQQEALTREVENTKQKLKELTDEYKNFGSVSAQQLQAAGDKMKDVGGKISDVGGTITKDVTLPLAAVGAAGAANFAEVDKTMQLANKTMGNTEEQAKLVNDAMKEAAANSTYGMSDASNAVLNFARAGLSAEQSAATLAPAMNLAAGEGGNLDTVSAGLVATINGFHGSFDDAGHYADVFAAACNNSALDINTLSESMSTAAPMFSAAGYSVEDATLALGLMGNAGIDANTAANSLKTGLARLVSPAKEGADALANLGFSSGSAEDNSAKLEKAQSKLEQTTVLLDAKQTAYNEKVAKYGENSSQAKTALAALIGAQEKQASAQQAVNLLTESGSEGMTAYGELMVDAEGNMRPFEDVLADLQGAFGNLSSEQQIAAASAIFGKNQMTSWLALIQTSPEKVTELSTSIHNCKDTTQEMADTMMSGFGGSIESLKSSIDVLMYSLGESLAPVIQKVIDFVQGIVDKLNAMDPTTRSIVVTIGLVAAAIGPVLVIIGNVITAIGTITSAIGAVMGFLGPLAAGIAGVGSTALLPVIGIIAGVVAAIGLVIAAVKNWGAISDWFKGVWSATCEGAKTVGSGLGEFFGGLWNGIKENTTNAWNGIKDGISTAWSATKDKITEVWNSIQVSYIEGGEGIAGVAEIAFDTVADIVTGVMDKISDFTGINLDGLKEKFRTAWIDIRTAVVDNGILVIQRNIIDKFTDAKNKAVEIFGNIKSGIEEKINAARDAVKSAIDKIKGFFNFHWELPKLKLPHFNISGSFSLNPPSAPSFGVSWYKKAMDEPYIMNSPTLFGMSGGKLLGGGEAGEEAVVGTERLGQIIREAVGGAVGEQTIVIPVYIGQERIDELVVKAAQRNNFRSGGR